MPHPSRTGAPRRSRRLLIIEGDEDLASLLVYHMRARGYRASAARTAREGLARAAAEGPDLVLLDRRLPDMDVLRLREMLRKMGPAPVLVWAAGSLKRLEEEVRTLLAGRPKPDVRSH